MAQRHRKKRKGREEYLKRQKQHYEGFKKLSKKRGFQRVSKSSPAKVIHGEILSPDILHFKKSKGKGQGKSSKK